MRLRPTGKSGSLVIPLQEFRRYYTGELQKAEGGAQLWERQALTRARVVFGDSKFGRDVMSVVADAAFGLPWRPELVDEILAMRERLEASRGWRDLKRGFGGMVDVDFLVQTFQLKYGGQMAALQTPNTWELLEALRVAGLLSAEEMEALRSGYDFLLQVQSRLRIVHNRSLDDIPALPDEVEKLARRLGFEASPDGRAAPQLLGELERHTAQLRRLFLDVLDRERLRG
jgi:[glutamine synthetase] adenylyltransferase / [glutamine synthetase]-adenylyl-L-tyrosine phosphorylase